MKKRSFISFLLIFVYLSTAVVGVSAISFDNGTVVSYSDNDNKTSLMTGIFATQTYAKPVTSYIYSNGDGTINILDATSRKINIDTYSEVSFEHISNMQIESELVRFGGFYSGKEYNYIAFYRDNLSESDELEVIRVVKYDKKFKRLEAFSLNDCYTTLPLSAGTLRMAEYGDELTVHTSRERYDGHQSQLSFTINTKTMTLLTENVGEFQSNHVSHSFNQFIKYDKGDRIFVDLGDAFPRSVVLINEIHPDNDLNYDFKKVAHMFKIPGNTGANETGITIGGFEISENNYLVAINTIKHSENLKYTSYRIEGLETDERDVVLLIHPKSGDETKQVYLTDYIGKGMLGSTPFIVPIPDNRFVVMWEEFEYYVNEFGTKLTEDKGLKYVCIDENGNLLSAVHHKKDMRLSKDCQPIYVDGKIIWYYSDGKVRSIQSVGIIGQPIKEAVYTRIVAKINGHDIASYNVEGYTCVVAEDLRNYGFDVTWNPDEKTLKIKKSSGKGITSTYVAPVVEKEKEGIKSFDILYTDIKTYIDGKEVTGYNIDGRTVVYFRDLMAYGEVTYDHSKKITELTIK